MVVQRSGGWALRVRGQSRPPCPPSARERTPGCSPTDRLSLPSGTSFLHPDGPPLSLTTPPAQMPGLCFWEGQRMGSQDSWRASPGAVALGGSTETGTGGLRVTCELVPFLTLRECTRGPETQSEEGGRHAPADVWGPREQSAPPRSRVEGTGRGRKSTFASVYGTTGTS